MIITDIKQQVKRSDRYSIYGDGKYIFSLSETELLNLGLKIDQEIDKAELEQLRHKATEDKAYDRCLNLISRRPRSEWEIAQYLIKKSYDDNTRQKTLDRLRESGYIDDLDFAQRWVESRRMLKKMSKLRLRQELRQKHLDDEIINQALSNDTVDEQDTLRDLIDQKRKQSRYQDKQKLVAYLARQGFKYGDIKQVLDES